MNEVSVRSSSNPMPTGQRYGGEDLLLPFESRHYSHQSQVTKVKQDGRFVTMLWVAKSLVHLLLCGVGWLIC